MALDFPGSPTEGQQFTGSNGASYRYTNGAWAPGAATATTTDAVPEGTTNLYYTNERVDDRAAALIKNGTGISWVYDDTAGSLTPTVSVSVASTDVVPEGTTNLYYTDERNDDRTAALIKNGTGITWAYNDAAGTLTPTVSVTGAALTKGDDTNVTLTLGGTPATALLQAASITAGWTGTLSAARGGFGSNVSAANGVPLFASGTPTFTSTTGTGNFVRAADPVFTGNPTAPTPTAGDNDTSIATTAFVTGALGLKADLASPVLTGNPTAPTATAGDNDTSIATTAFVTGAVATASASGFSAAANLLVNGGIDFRQRGTGTQSGLTGSTPVKLGADRWQLIPNDSTCTVSYVLGNPGPADQRIQFNINRTVAGSTNTQFMQRIEGASTANGQTVTVSFDIGAFEATKSGLSVRIDQNFGTGGSPSATVSTSSSTFSTVSTGGILDHIVLSINVPSVNGKNLGDNGDDYLQFNIMLPGAAGTANFRLTNFDMRIGTSAPVRFLRRLPQEELALCQRYYQKIGGIVGTVYGGSGGQVEQAFIFPVSMRAAPAVAFSSVSYANASGLTLNVVNSQLVRAKWTVTATGTGAAYFDVALDAEL